MTQSPINPFALLVCPQATADAVARSERLLQTGQLRRRVCRPLDRPQIPIRAGAKGLEAVAFEGR
jgi:hypothetical protein